MTAAGFVAYLAVSHGINAWYTLLIGGLVGAILTLLLGVYVFRPYARRGAKLFEMMMVTLGLALVIDYGLQAISHNNIYQFTVLQSAPLKFGPILITPTELILAIVGLVVYIALEMLLKLTRIGKALRATAAEPTLARSCGIRTGRVVVITWVLSGFLCGLAGVVYIINSQSIGYATGELFLPLVVAAALLGGAGSPRGAVLASLLMGIVTQIVAAFGQPAYSTVAGFAVLVVVLLARPGAIGSAVGGSEVTL